LRLVIESGGRCGAIRADLFCSCRKTVGRMADLPEWATLN
jgi:hypothetical protein